MKQKHIAAFMQCAETFAQLSTAKKLKVGAIIVKDDRIISIGYNGMPAGLSNECELEITSELVADENHSYVHSVGQLVTKPEVLHAEANALAKVARSSESSERATLFCTHTPCLECAKMIYQSGIERVYVKTPYAPSKGSGERFLRLTSVDLVYL